MRKFFFHLLVLVLGGVHMHAQTAVALSHADIRGANVNYPGNRAPLLPLRFIKLPVNAFKPGGWLKAQLLLQKDGLTGHLGEISIWLSKADNAWLNKRGTGKYGWEELPYWLKGNGDRDLWANMPMIWCLRSYYEYSHDRRVITCMTRYFKWLQAVPDEQFLKDYWENSRGGDYLVSIYWLYNITGDKFLLDVAGKVDKNTANWRQANNLPNWHNVNVAECFREPATYYLQSHHDADLAATYNDFKLIRDLYGQVPGGMFG